MNLYPKKESLKDVLSGERKYVVPAYQRPYEWGKDEIINMLDSIREHIDTNCEENLLFGTLQFNADKIIIENNFSKVYDGEISCEIIDGHQRITTFYILRKFLGTEKLPNISNEINRKSLEENLKSAKYVENRKCIENYFKNDAVLKDKFKNFIDNKIIFVSIYVSKVSSIATTLKIFNSINTTGLSLDVKDIFKINFCDYLCEDSTLERSDVLKKINQAYENITKFDGVYSLDENALLDVFRFHIMKINNNFTQERLRASNNMFFIEKDGLFNGNNKLKLSKKEQLDVFCEIAECMSKTQKYLEKHDKGKINLVKHCAKELLKNSGYGKLTNLYYYFVYEQDCNEKIITDEIISNTENAVTAIWKYCSIFASSYSRQIYEVYREIADVLNRGETNNIEEILQKKLGEHTNNADFKDFKAIFKNAVFTNRMKHLFVMLSYIDDCENEVDAISVKNDMFYRQKWNLDIEHIISHRYSNPALNEEDKIENSIGNLMYLDRSLNRKLGKMTVGFNFVQDDYNNKIKNYSEKVTLQCVRAFLENYQKYNSPNDAIEKRRDDKVKFLKKLYDGYVQKVLSESDDDNALLINS